MVVDVSALPVQDREQPCPCRATSVARMEMFTFWSQTRRMVSPKCKSMDRIDNPSDCGLVSSSTGFSFTS
jgi:hypothetical protein